MDETPADVERELHARIAVGDEPALDPEWPPPVRPPLRRRAQGKWIAGVAGGLADHWAVPAIVLRIPLAIAGLVAAGIAWNVVAGDGGTLDPSDGLAGLIVVGSISATVVYAALWIVLPREDVTRSPVGRFTERYPTIRSVPGFVALAIGGAILADRLGIWEPDLVLAAGLIALGVWLYRRDRTRPSHVDRVPQGAETVVVDAGVASVPARVLRPPRERSPLGWITFGVALLLVSVAAIWTSLAGDALATVHRAVGLTRISTIPAIGLLVLAAGLLVGSVFGRARWLILPALLVVPVLLVTSVIRLPFDGEFGNAYVRPAILGENEVVARRNSVGSVYVDLARFQGRADVERELELTTVVGTVSVVVPFDAHVRIDAFTGLGTIGFGPRSTYGLEISDSAILEPRHGDGPTFVVHAQAGLGDILVYRYAPTKGELRQLQQEERRRERQERRAEQKAAA